MTCETEAPGSANFSCLLFESLFLRWQAWRGGILPGATPGAGRQNPRLLAAFAALDRAAHRAEEARRPRPVRPQESAAAFAARVGANG